MGDFTVSDSVLVRLELIEDSVSGINSKSYLYPRGVKIEIKNFSSYDIFLPNFLPLSSNIKIYYEDESVGYVDYTDTWSNNLMVIPEDYRYRKESPFVANSRKLKHKDVIDSLLVSFGRKNELTSLQQYELEQTYKYFDLKTLLLKKDQTYQGVISLQPLMLQRPISNFF